MKRMRITLEGDDNVKLVERLCSITGMAPPSLIALLVRKYGRELEAWIGEPVSLDAPDTSHLKKPLELPTDPGESLVPIDL